MVPIWHRPAAATTNTIADAVKQLLTAAVLAVRLQVAGAGAVHQEAGNLREQHNSCRNRLVMTNLIAAAVDAAMGPTLQLLHRFRSICVCNRAKLPSDRKSPAQAGPTLLRWRVLQV